MIPFVLNLSQLTIEEFLKSIGQMKWDRRAKLGKEQELGFQLQKKQEGQRKCTWEMFEYYSKWDSNKQKLGKKKCYQHTRQD